MTNGAIQDLWNANSSLTSTSTTSATMQFCQLRAVKTLIHWCSTTAHMKTHTSQLPVSPKSKDVTWSPPLNHQTVIVTKSLKSPHLNESHLALIWRGMRLCQCSCLKWHWSKKEVTEVTEVWFKNNLGLSKSKRPNLKIQLKSTNSSTLAQKTIQSHLALWR